MRKEIEVSVPEVMDDSIKPYKDENAAREARMAYEVWQQYFKVNNDQYHMMYTFVMGRQWDDDEEDMLKNFKKVPLTANKLPTLVNNLRGEQQQNTPQVEITPLSGCTEEQASLRQNIVKDIMFSTNAAAVYQKAFDQAAIGGYGVFFLLPKYKHEHSFEQDPDYFHLKDATKAYFDIGCEDPIACKTDGMVCGFTQRLTRIKFRSIYGKDIEEDILKDMGITATKEEIALATDTDLKDDSSYWADNEGITINNNFTRTYEKDVLYKLSNGVQVFQKELEELIEKSKTLKEQLKAQQELLGEFSGMEDMPIDNESEDLLTIYYEGRPVRIEEKKTVKRSIITYKKFAGDYVLEKMVFPTEDLPGVFVDQDSWYDKDGKQICRPFLIDVVDTQRYINYLRTQSAFILKISRYDQFMGSKKNVQSNDTQQQWRDPSNVKGMITYDESPTGAKPEQIRPPELSASLFQQYDLAVQDLYTSTGLYPARLGQEDNAESGKAINARTRQGSFITQVPLTPLNRAITAGAKILNQMIPKLWDTERVINVMTPDKGRQTITINKQADEYGELIENDIRKGTFTVELKAGPSYEGQKQEALGSLNMVLQAKPDAFDLVADLYAENLPLMNTLEIKNRLKTLVPTQIIEAGKTGRMPQETGQPNPQQQAMQMEMQLKAKEVEIKEKELMLKAQQQQTDLQIELMKLEAEKMALAKDLEEEKMRFMAETHRTHSDEAIAHADNLVKILTHKVDMPSANKN